MKDRGVVPFLLGAVVALLAANLSRPGFPRALADGVSSAHSGWIVVPGNSDQGRGTRETVFVLDPSTQRMAVYSWNVGAGTLTLSAVREIAYDLKFQEYSAAGKEMQSPPVKKIEEEWKKRPR